MCVCMYVCMYVCLYVCAYRNLKLSSNSCHCRMDPLHPRKASVCSSVALRSSYWQLWFGVWGFKYFMVGMVLKNVHSYSLLGLSIHQNATCYPTMTKVLGAPRVEEALAQGFWVEYSGSWAYSGV